MRLSDACEEEQREEEAKPETRALSAGTQRHAAGGQEVHLFLSEQQDCRSNKQTGRRSPVCVHHSTLRALWLCLVERLPPPPPWPGDLRRVLRPGAEDAACCC